MAKARLNKKQRNWVNKFLDEHPYLRVDDIYDTLADNDRMVCFAGWQRLVCPNIPGYKGEYPAFLSHNLKVVLRKYGDPRKTSEHKVEVVYQEMDSTNPFQEEQISLQIASAINSIPKVNNPVIAVWKPSKPVAPKLGTQLSLPVSGIEAELFKLRQQKRPYLPPASSQEILAEKVLTWNARDKREVELPQVIIDMLNSQGANDAEWESAMDLYEIAGLSCAMDYAVGLPVFRRLKGQPEVSLVQQSASVQPEQSLSQQSISQSIQSW